MKSLHLPMNCKGTNKYLKHTMDKLKSDTWILLRCKNTSSNEEKMGQSFVLL